MSVVIGIDWAKKGDEKTVYTITGPAICTHCSHKWTAVTPVGNHDDLECSACGLFMGIFGAPVIPREFWVCGCGSDLFYLTKAGAACRLCGLVSSAWVE